MERKRRLILTAGGAAAAVAVAAGAGVAAAGGDDDEQPLTGDTLDRASAAALDAVPGGRVTETETDDEDGATYEVEVTREDGTQVDVRLDDNFAVVTLDEDHETPDDDD